MKRLLIAIAAICLIAVVPSAGRAAQTCDTLVLVPTQLDIGSSGYAHDLPWPQDQFFSLQIVSRCQDDDSVCSSDSDCSAGSCTPTCSGQAGADEACQYSSAATPRRCISDMSQTCSTNSDCDPDGGFLCVAFLGTPVPLISAGCPACVVPYLRDDAQATVDMTTGETSVALSTKWRIYLQSAEEQPCPRCQPTAAIDAGTIDVGGIDVGASGVCVGGLNDGRACSVEAVSEHFGGLSSDCPPEPAANISGQGVSVKFHVATTGGEQVAATLPCASPFNAIHPSSGSGACLNDFSPCSSNDDCDGATCGLYCHCGFCDEGSGPDPGLPCMNDADCDTGVCAIDPEADGLSQLRPNGCQSLVCGEVNPEECCTPWEEGCETGTPPQGGCNDHPSLCTSNQDCVLSGAGDECVFSPRKCFENTIATTGQAIASTNICISDAPSLACTSNDDCSMGACEPGCPQAALEMVGCISSSSSACTNSSFDLPGPLRLSLVGFMTESEGSCGDGIVGASEDCDDGNAAPYDGCARDCTLQPVCGDVDGSGGASATDALAILRRAVALLQTFVCDCDDLACADFDGSLSITATDAYMALLTSVGVEVPSGCPVCDSN